MRAGEIVFNTPTSFNPVFFSADNLRDAEFYRRAGMPVAADGTEFVLPGAVVYGVERCFAVRAVDSIDTNSTAQGILSPIGCVTPKDTFPPAVPKSLGAIAGAGVINLIWDANTEADLAGYIVLRGEAPGDTLRAITPAPVKDTRFRDETVRPGVRYVYAVVAVDNADPQTPYIPCRRKFP